MRCLDDDTVLRLVDGQLVAGLLVGIDEHLDDCASCRGVIAQVARTQAGVVRGQAIGRYVIGELLGAGAMGRVYSAWEPELDRRVALKVVRDGPRAALVREAQAMARLSHPNVVAVHEVGTTSDAVYVAMELVAGESLRAWSRTAVAPTRRRRLAALVDIARGLAAVHAAGIVHRDIKPDNIIVANDGRARLGDFGLASTGAEAAIASTVAGTPAYMAPEVLRGGAATPASDQFSFGVTAIELLTGARPFAGRSWSQLIHAIEAGDAAIADPVLRRCLAVDPAARWPSLGDVADQLAARLARRRPLWIGAAVAAAAIASAVTWMVARPQPAVPCELGAAELAAVWNRGVRAQLGDAPHATAALDAWGARWVAERDATCRADAPPLRLAARARCLDDRRAELGALVDRLRGPSPGFDRVGDALEALPSPTECRAADIDSAAPLPLEPGRAAIARAVAGELPAIRAAVALGDAAAVAAAATAAVARARDSHHAPTLADAELALAQTLAGQGQLDAAAGAARDAVADAERGRADAIGARAWLQRVAIAGDRRALADADDLAPIAAAAIDRAGSPEHLVAVLARLRGLVAYNRGDLAAARALLDRARALAIADTGEHSLATAAVESALGSVARAAGDLDAAERHHRAALALDRELRGDRHPDIARDLHNLAGVLRLRGDLRAAAATYRDALAIEVASHGANSVEAGLTHNSLGLVAMAREDWAEARSELELARVALTAAHHGDRALAEHNLGLVAAATGDPAAALAHYATAAEVYADTIGDAAEPAQRLVLDRAVAHRALGQLGDARAAATQAARSPIPWIASDAAKLLAALPPPTRRVAVATAGPTPTIVAPAPPAPSAPPVAPRHDVGTYGASQPWQ